MGADDKRELWVTWGGGRVRGEQGIITIGRDTHCEVCILGDAGVSRRHASLKLLPTAIKLQDLGSRNGTFVEGRRLTGAALLSGGEAVRVGTTELRAFASEQALLQAGRPARSRSQAPSSGELVDTTVSTNVFGGLLRDVARATLTNPNEVEPVVAEACETAQRLALDGSLTPPDAAVVADCSIRQALQTNDGVWLDRVFRLYTVAKLPLPIDLARRVIKARTTVLEFPEEELGAYVGVLAGMSPPDPYVRAQVATLFRVLTGAEEP